MTRPAASLISPLFSTHPGLSALFSLLAEPAGAAAGVAYLMTFFLSSPAVDPNTLAPKGTLLDAEKVKRRDGEKRDEREREKTFNSPWGLCEGWWW